MSISFLQWNILVTEPIENIAKTIKSLDPDIAVLQEISKNFEEQNQKDTGKYLANELGYNYFVKEAHIWKDGRLVSNGIYTKHKILNSKYIYIKNSEDGADEDWSKEGRVYIEASIDMNSRVLNIGTTHLSYVSAFKWNDDKEKEAKKLLNILKDKNKNFIFGGDLNAFPDSSVVRGIMCNLQHCGPSFEEKTFANKPFDDGRGFSGEDLAYRIDYVFASYDLKILSSKIVQTPFSDHLPILVEFE